MLGWTPELCCHCKQVVVAGLDPFKWTRLTEHCGEGVTADAWADGLPIVVMLTKSTRTKRLTLMLFKTMEEGNFADWVSFSFMKYLLSFAHEKCVGFQTRVLAFAR